MSEVSGLNLSTINSGTYSKPEVNRLDVADHPSKKGKKNKDDYKPVVTDNGWYVDIGASYSPSPAIADLFNDGKLEIIAASLDGVFVMDSEGNELQGWPKIFDNPQEIMRSSPAVADINNDGKKEIIIGSSSGHLYVFNADGSLYQDCSDMFYIDKESILTPAVGDVNGDGEEEIVVCHSGEFGYGLTVFNNQGEILPNWPKYLEPQTFPGDYGASNPVLCDINKDGKMEILISNADQYYIFNSDATLIPGWPIKLASDYQMYGYPHISSAAVHDVDEDGETEIAVFWCGKNYLLKPNGSIQNGWPKTFNVSPMSESYDYYSSIIGDINADGIDEIIMVPQDNASGIFQSDGNEIWGQGTFYCYGVTWNGVANCMRPQVIADMNNDCYLDMISSDTYYPNSNIPAIYIFSGKDGQNLSSSPIKLNTENIVPVCTGATMFPVIGDVDLDGKLEIVCQDQYSTRLYFVKTDGVCEKGALPWPMLWHDNQRTNYYGAIPCTPPPPVQPLNVINCYPNPFNHSTVIELTATASQIDGSSMAIYDLLGRKIKTKFDVEYDNDKCFLTWDGTNESGSPVSSGIYLFRIESGKSLQSIKIEAIR